MADNESPDPLPRVTIKFCTQCKWMLRAAYYAQELLSTFSTSLGEVALQPSTGGTFVVHIIHAPAPPASSSDVVPAPAPQSHVLWDRTVDGGFPETKELKRRVRDVIEPGRDLGHVDRDHAKVKPRAEATAKDGVGGGAATATAPAQPRGAGEERPAREVPSRAELEAAGQAGGGYPGSSEAAAQLVGDLNGPGGGGETSESKAICEDCN